ncbi:endophilin-A3a isoform X2 [Pungitius pungitius]|uniref:endophilin-A3a isoform X2 n=1 Tax=Pungitius pungitius TaxID=134920 RepID=UPI002E149F8E
MSVAGLKKQFHKASQLLSEKISGAEGTKLDEDFMEMERKIEVTNKSVFDLLSKTTEYLQPNPASRAKLNMLNTVSKMRGQVSTTGYPQTEGLLGDCMLRYGHELGEDSVFGCALVEMGEAMRQMADVKDALDISVKQNFLDPLQNLQDKDLKEITHHLKKMEGRRLDFDYKKKRHGRIPDEEIRQAVEKFDESRELAERSMFNFLENDVEQARQLLALIQAATEYHRQSREILQELSAKLQRRISTASSRPRRDFNLRSIRSSVDSSQHNGLSSSSSLRPAGTAPPRLFPQSHGSCSPSPSSLYILFFLLSHTDVQINPAVNGKTVHITSVPLSWPESPTINGSVHRCSAQLTRVPVSSCGAAGELLDQPCCRSLYDFEPENEGELGFKEGDVIILTNRIDDNWYEGMISGESGFFPVNYVEVLVPLPQ